MPGMATTLDELPETLDEKLVLSSQRSNALSNRVSQVLSASYADSDIRDTLYVLDRRQIKNSPDIRRNLRLDVEKELLQRNAEIVDNFGQVAERLKQVGATIKSLERCCEGLRVQISGARQENVPVLDEASTLIQQKGELETKQQLLNAFHKHFILSEGELFDLTSSTRAIDDGFFIMLGKAKQIRADCKLLLGTEHQRLGLELMEQTSRNLDSGYQKLFRWIQLEFKSLNLENPQMGSVIRRALKALAERPTLFQSCLDFFAEARERVLADAFFTSLTGSTTEHQQSVPAKPIEMFAHDPLRYIGDMLAWTHSSAVSEHEALEALFVSESESLKKGFEAGKEAEPWLSESEKSFDGRKAVREVVNRDLAGVSQLLRQRIEQVLQNHDNGVILYKIANLLNFYTSTFSKLLGTDSSLLNLLLDLKSAALRQFAAVENETVTSVSSDLAAPRPDCAIPDFLRDALVNFAALMRSYDSSIFPSQHSSTSTTYSQQLNDFALVVSQALNPFMSACDKMAKQISAPTSTMFTANCLLAVQTTLGSYKFIQTKKDEITERLAQCSATLTEHQHVFFLRSSGLEPLTSALSDSADATDITTLPAFQPSALTDASQNLDDFLPSALMDALDNLANLNSRDMARVITADAAERFCEDFELIEARLIRADESSRPEKDVDDDDEEEEEEDSNRLRNLFPRTSGEIRVLLS